MEQQLQSAGQTQNAPEKKKWYKKWWVITIGVVILIGVIGSSGGDKTSKPVAQEPDQKAPQVADNKPVEKPAEPAQVVPKIVVTSINLSKAYSDNEVSADAKYKGMGIEVSGKITSIDNGIGDNELIVTLSDGQYDFSGPRCYIRESEREKVLAFKKGQQVTLIGTGDSATLKSPDLKDCTVK